MMPRQYGELGGVLCPGKNCGQEVFRLLDGVCVQCAQKVQEATDEEIEEVSKAEGTLMEMRKRYPGMVSMKSLRRAKERILGAKKKAPAE